MKDKVKHALLQVQEWHRASDNAMRQWQGALVSPAACDDTVGSKKECQLKQQKKDAAAKAAAEAKALADAEKKAAAA